MIRIVLAWLFLHTALFACALCTIYQPSVTVDLQLESKENKLSMLHITWKFAQEFSSELARDYDANANNIFEPQEIAQIQQAIVDYIKPLNFLTTIKYNTHQEQKFLDDIDEVAINTDSIQTYFVDDLLRFSYQVPLDFEIASGDVLFVSIHDSAGFFVFQIDGKDVKFENETFTAVINSRSYATFLEFQKDLDQSAERVARDHFQEYGLDLFSEVQSEGVIVSTLQGILQNVSQKIQTLLDEVKTAENKFAIWTILLFSLLYGALHAAGPAHGKTIVASYIFSTNKNVQKALIIALLIGTVHAFSAFILTLFIYFAVSGLLMPFVDSVGEVVTKISAVVIISIALMLLYNKIKNHLAQKKMPKFSLHKPTCGCASCKVDSKTTDLGVILSAGLVPCPGTVVIFILTITQGLFWVGLMSAVMMSLGMSAVIFLTALLSMGLKTKFQNNQKVLVIFEYSAIGLILILGSLMLLV